MTDSDVLEIAGLIHQRWVDAFTSLKAVRNEINDRSPDWEEFHNDRLELARAEEMYWSGIKDRFMDEHRGVFDAMLGEPNE